MTKENVVIFGGDLANKGAQAMTLTVVDQIRRRFPDKEVYLFSTSAFEREDSVKGAYSFGFLPWTSRVRIKLLLGPFVRNQGRHSRKYDQIKEVLQGTSFIIDVSGYVLSSQWGLFLSLGYLANILIAKKYSIPFYIFPQSLGPFDYPLMQKLVLYPLLRLCLVYPRIIFVREREGLKHVRRFTKRNVKQSSDVVLQNPAYDVANIYIGDVSLKAFDVTPNSVAVIPNMRVVDRVGPEKLDAIYRSLIAALVGADFTVYIVRHSDEDLGICKRLKSLFPDDAKVKLIEDELNAIELESVLEKFDFIIASRYHSIVHAYKNSVPAIVMGWAGKYYELLKEFDQAEYCFDCRKTIDIDDLNGALKRMMLRRDDEKRKIGSRMNCFCSNTVFDLLADDLAGCGKETSCQPEPIEKHGVKL